MTTRKEAALRAELSLSLDKLIKAKNQCERSFEKCSLLTFREDLSSDDLEIFDAFTSRFARLSDLLFMRLFRIIDNLELMSTQSTLDSLNQADRRGLIPSAMVGRQIRELRNEIAHEYSLRGIGDLIDGVLQLTPVLLDSVSLTIKYCQRWPHQE